MKLPISFEEVAYFRNEFRGDLIITIGVIYYFPHTRVKHARYSDELAGKEVLPFFELFGNFVPFLGTIPLFHLIADKSIKAGKFLRRTFHPKLNSPRISKIQLWHQNISNEKLQETLDNYIERVWVEDLKFDEDSVPKPMRFSVNDIINAKLGLKFKFDSKYDNHDFRVNLIHRKQFVKALKQAGFIK